MSFLEDVGRIFRGDPTFDYVFNLPKPYFMKVVELRRAYIKKNNKSWDLSSLFGQ